MIVPILKFVYDRKKTATTTKEAPVELRITYERRSKWMTTGIKVLPKHWHRGTILYRADAQELNAMLDSIMVKARKVVNSMIESDSLNLDEIPKLIKQMSQEKKRFIDFCEERTEVRVYGKSQDSAERYYRFLRWLRSWNKIVFFSDVTDKNIILMDEELAKTKMKAYSKWNNYHRFMNSFIIDAIDEGMLKRNPYKWLHIEKEKSNSLHKFLTLNELRLIEKSTMPTPCLDRVRDLFVFQTYTCMSYVDMVDFDLSKLKQENNLYIYTNKRGKTGIEFTFVLLKAARHILEKYDGELPIISNMKYNDYLKLVAQAAGVDKPITSHWARHTGATILLNEGGVDMEIVARVLGHSSTRQTRETYAKLLDQTIAKAMSGAESRISKHGSRAAASKQPKTT